MPHYLGIDPGVGGSMVCLSYDEEGLSMVCSLDLKTATDDDILRYLTSRLSLAEDEPVHAVVEKVGGYIQTTKGSGGARPGAHMFQFGVSYGKILMALTAVEIRYELVTPAVWMKGLSISSREKLEGKSQYKRRLKAFATELFPEYQITLANADAFLLAEYCRRIHHA